LFVNSICYAWFIYKGVSQTNLVLGSRSNSRGSCLKTRFLFIYRKTSICPILAITYIIPVYRTCCYKPYNETRHYFDNRKMYYQRTILIDNVRKSMFDNCSACCINRSVLIFRQQCCNEQTWMRSNRLQLNTAKTEVIWRASSRRQHQIPQTPLTVGSDTVVLVCVVRDLGIYLDSSADADTRCKDCVKLLCGVTADPERQTVFVKTDSADSGRVTRPDQTRLWLRHIGRTSCQPTRQTAVGTECRGATHLWSTKKIRPRDAAASRVALAASARTHYLPAGDTCVSLSAQHGATLSCSLAKSREHRRLSTAIALGINV